MHMKRSLSKQKMRSSIEVSSLMRHTNCCMRASNAPQVPGISCCPQMTLKSGDLHGLCNQYLDCLLHRILQHGLYRPHNFGSRTCTLHSTTWLIFYSFASEASSGDSSKANLWVMSQRWLVHSDKMHNCRQREQSGGGGGGCSALGTQCAGHVFLNVGMMLGCPGCSKCLPAASLSGSIPHRLFTVIPACPAFAPATEK